MKNYKHVSASNGKFVWQVTVLGHPVRSGEHFDTAEEAACSCQLFKHYLQTEFRLQTVESLDGEMFATLAYRQSVDLSNSLSVFASLTDSAKQFVDTHRAELEGHKEANPESTADKFRRSGMMDSPAIREWVNKLDAASIDATAFSRVDSKSFSLRLSVIERGLQTSLKSLGLAQRMHEGVTNPRLVERARLLTELQTHLQATTDHIKFLSELFRKEQDTVVLALQTLESSRPALT